FQKEPLVPQVTVSLDKETLFEHVLIIPKSIAIITQTLAKSEVGQITVRYPQLEPADTEEEFDDEEQLYSAAAIDASRRKFPDTDSPLYAVSGADNAQILIATVPHFTNPIAEKKSPPLKLHKLSVVSKPGLRSPLPAQQWRLNQ
ncbi:hypothetical protein OXX59_010244, partial [Metschnikowia pulcherrima]